MLLKAFLKSANFGISMLLVAAAIAIAYIAVPAFGNQALIVRSGSMQPIIKVGDLVVVNTQLGKYQIGDIVAFKDVQDPKLITTHRVVSIKTKDNKVFYQTKGDANNAADKSLVSSQNIIGKATTRLPYLGRLFAFAKSRVGFASLVIFPAILVIIFESLNILKEIRKRPTVSKKKSLPTFADVNYDSDQLRFPPLVEIINPKKENTKFPKVIPLPGLFGFKILIPLAICAMIFQNSFAFFTATATSTGNIFTASSSFGPNPGGVVINELMWVGSSRGASDEWIELRNTTNHEINLSGWQITKWVSGGGGHEDLMITIPAGKSIAANSFFLIAQFPSGDPGSVLNVEPDVVTTNVALNNDALQIRLYVNNWNSGGMLVNTAGNKGEPLAGEHKNSTPKRFYSMERNSTPGDGTSATNWHTATTSVGFDSGQDVENRGTPKSANSPP